MASKAQRFGEVVRQRREELGLSHDQVAARGGPSDTWMSQAENGQHQSVRPSTLAKLDRALSWPDGAARRLWNEGVATHVGQARAGLFGGLDRYSTLQLVEEVARRLKEEVNDGHRDTASIGQAGEWARRQLAEDRRPHAGDYTAEDYARVDEFRRAREEGGPEIYVDQAAQHRTNTPREFEAPDEGA